MVSLCADGALWFHLIVMFDSSELPPVEAEVNLSVIESNTALLKKQACGVDLMAVIKANGYGHGAPEVARAAMAGGADLLGVATLDEAIALRDTGIDSPLVAWLWSPCQDARAAVAAGIQIGVSSVAHLRRVVNSHVSPRETVQVHLMVDTGLGRAGTTMGEFAELARAAAVAETTGDVHVVGVMSHLASADVPGDESVDEQLTEFGIACETARAAGLRPRWRHIANTAATLTRLDAHLDMVRCGIGLYGLPPVPTDLRLRPAMTLRARVALAKQVPAGQGVGYGLTYRTAHPATLALIPLGYGDGLPRIAGNVGEVLIAGRRRRIAGRIAMDQIVVDCGRDQVRAGDEVIIFGPGDVGEPTARQWAEYCRTIDYEIVTRIGARVVRRYVTDRLPDTVGSAAGK